MMMKDHIFPGNCFERILITNSKIAGPWFRSILSSTLAWSKWLVRRTIHKYERFFSDKDGFLAIRPVLRTILWNVRFLNCLVEVPQLHGIQRLVC
jgi:hypothetical protein